MIEVISGRYEVPVHVAKREDALKLLAHMIKVEQQKGNRVVKVPEDESWAIYSRWGDTEVMVGFVILTEREEGE